MIIGVSGRIGSGKDTVGAMIEYLSSECSNKDGNHYRTFDEFQNYRDGKGNHFQPWYNSDWEIKKFAGKLKQIASILTGIPTYKFEDQEFKKTFLGTEWDYMERSGGEFGNEWTHTQMTVRELLQKLGTDAMRNGLHTDVWVNATLSEYLSDTVAEGTDEFDVLDKDQLPKWIITDVRFPNEANAIILKKGVLIRVIRPGQPMADLHPSETSLDDYSLFSYTIMNDGTLDDLLNKVSDILGDLKKKSYI